MEFEQEENKVFTYITYAFIFVFVVAIVVLGFLGLKGPSSQQVSELENTLTPQEVADEREKLRSSNPNAVVSENTYQDENTATSSSESKTATKPPIARSTNDDLKLDTSNSITVDAQTIESIEVYDPSEGSGAGVSVTSVSQEKEQKTAEGTIYLRHPEKNQIVIVLANDQGLAGIFVTPNTKYTMNGKPISFTDLREGDSLIINGHGEVGNSTITATDITVTGFIQATP